MSRVEELAKSLRRPDSTHASLLSHTAHDDLRIHKDPNAVSSHRRARELYKYFQPHLNDTFISRDDATDLLLTTQAELVALRLGGKCLINLLDDSTQYIVAEADRDGSFNFDTASSEIPQQTDNVAWTECRGQDSTSNSVCRITVEADFTGNNGQLPFFEVEDLRLDDRFASIPLVTNPPYLRYYGGVPIFSKSGIAIGAVVVVDRQPRKPMEKAGIRFLHDTAKNVMRLLELQRSSLEERRSSHMNQCLAAFMSAGSSRRPSLQGNHSKFGIRTDASNSQQVVSFTKDSTADTDTLSSSESTPVADTSVASQGGEETMSRARNSFRKGADGLCDALGEHCGVTILDTVGITTPYPAESPEQSRSASSLFSRDSGWTRKASASHFASSRGPSPVLAASPAQALAHQPCPNSASRAPNSRIPRLIPMSIEQVGLLSDHYPHGMNWYFDERGNTYDEEDALLNENRSRVEQDGQILKLHIPHVTSVYMKPIWNAQSDRAVICFCYSISEFRILTREHDVPFINAFCNCIHVELVRLATLASDEQKSDFMGTISHELRSPLHGILASCDLLQETDLSRSQDSLIRMVNSCGRTLLDTLSMVLDWSKVNTFERDWKTLNPARRASNASTTPGVPNLTQAELMPCLYANVDLAAVVEEVVEGSVIGHGFQTENDLDLTDISREARGQSSCHKTSKRSSSYQSTSNQVEVLLEITRPASTWVYLTQPGAFRRILMNLVGNALKFTTQGYVKVSLRIATADPSMVSQDTPAVYDTVVLEIEDTGRGIGRDYLKNRIFSAFSQESAISVGTGLGLSLTKSIVDMLEGNINIKSAPNEGTTVIVSIPMPRAQRGIDSRAGTPSSAGSVNSNTLETVRRVGQDRQLAYYQEPSANGVSPLRLTLEKYLSEWFSLSLHLWSEATKKTAEVLFVNDTDLFILLDAMSETYGRGTWPPIVVLCSDTMHLGDILAGRQLRAKLELVAKPFGPHRLTQTLRSCFANLPSPLREDDAQPTSPELTLHDSTPEARDSSVIGSQSADYIGAEIYSNTDSVSAHMALGAAPSTTSTTISRTIDAPDMDEYFPPAPIHLEGEPVPKSNIETEGGETSITPVDNVKPVVNMPPPPPIRHNTDMAFALSTTSARPARILVVDDNPINLRLISTYMAKLHYTHVATAADGRAAAEAFRIAIETTLPYDVVWMDLSMPIMDGFASTAEMRNLEARHAARLSPLLTPRPAMIVALTGLASEKDRAKAFEAGVDLYMTKPATFKEVGRLMKNWEANGGVKASDSLPHGSVTGTTPTYA